jgi:acetyl-CoA acetyltransferase
MAERTLRGKVAVIGIGETTYYKHGQSPDSEFALVIKAILAACEDAGVDPKDVDSFASYSNDRNDPSRISAALGCRELRLSNMQWGGGGGGGAAAVGNAAAAIVTGQADIAVVYRALAQGQFARFGRAQSGGTVAGDNALINPYGIFVPAQRFALKFMRYMHEHGIRQEALRALAMASYHHAQSNPRAVMYGRPLTEAAYDASRWISEPYHLFDCCQENDGAAALVLVSAERAKDFRHKPAYVLAVAQGSDHRNAARAFNAPDFASSSFGPVAPHLWEMAKLGPKDVDVLQSYENFTGGVLMSLTEHGFVEPEACNEFLTLENLSAPSGKLPLNTSGGNLAECYMHGLELQIEAVRQLRGSSTAQVPGAMVAGVIAGPMVTPVSTMIFGSEETL